MTPEPLRLMHPAEEANLREWLAGESGTVVILSRPVVAALLADVDAARAGRPVLAAAAVPAHVQAREAAQLAPDGEE